MKISDIQNFLDIYKTKSGFFRGIKYEPHIKELKDFRESLGSNERALTSKELLKLVNIGLAKKNDNGSASSQTFNMLFSAIGCKEIYIKLQQENVLNAESVFIISNLATQPDAPIRQIIDEFDTIKEGVDKLGQSVKANPKMKEIINLLTLNHQFNIDILQRLSLVKDSEIQGLYDCLSILNGRLLNGKNIQSCIQFSLNPKAIHNLLLLLKATTESKHLDQHILSDLFKQFDGMRSFNISEKSIDYLRKIECELEPILCFLLCNVEVDIDNVLVELEQLNLDSNEQTVALLQIVLKDYHYHDTILSGVKHLSPGNRKYINIVSSYPQYAQAIAETFELLTSKDFSDRFKTRYEHLLKVEAQHAGSLLKLLQVFKENGFLVENNISWALDNFEKSKDILLCIHCLQKNSIFKQKNIDRMSTYRGPMDLLHKGLQALSKGRMLTQDNFDILLDNTLTYDSREFRLVVEKLSVLATENNFNPLSYRNALKRSQETVNQYDNKLETNTLLDSDTDSSENIVENVWEQTSDVSAYSLFFREEDEEEKQHQSWYMRLF